MPLIPFPNVPNVPGVPALPRLASGSALAGAGLGLVQGALWRSFQVDRRWGIFDSAGKALADPAKFTGPIIGGTLEALGLGSTLSFNGIDYSKETHVSDFPIERGSFASYNKVESAANPTVVLCLTGSESDRTTFLDAIDKASKSTDLYSIVTPEVTYLEYSVERYNYSRRSNKGATLLMVEITLKEIRQVSSQYSQANKTPISSPKDVGATATADGGKVQAQTPDVSTLKSVANKLPGLADKAKSYLQGLVQ